MKTITLKATKRVETGKKHNKILRKEGLVPGVLYGNEKENVLFAISVKELKNVIFTNKVYIINLDVEGEVYTCIKKDAQFHPVKDNTLHVDFLRVSEDKPVKMFIPVTLTGFAKGVQAGGHLYQMKHYINIKASLENIPDQLEIDVTNLTIGKSLQIKEMKHENIEILEPASDVVAMVKLTRAAMSKADSESDEEDETTEEKTEE
ncbi:MAG: 50S ribosomal protein L25 [Bacteroidales bacterium]|nr:50S ribosomal protein L25 [Bacteroidales bacterium]